MVTTAVQNAVPRPQLGTATAAGVMFRQIGGSLAVAVFGAIWALAFSLPVLFNVPENIATHPGKKAGIIESYKILFRKIADLYKNARPTFYFLLASAVFRDGLAAVFDDFLDRFLGCFTGKVVHHDCRTFARKRAIGKARSDSRHSFKPACLPARD